MKNQVSNLPLRRVPVLRQIDQQTLAITWSPCVPLTPSCRSIICCVLMCSACCFFCSCRIISSEMTYADYVVIVQLSFSRMWGLNENYFLNFFVLFCLCSNSSSSVSLRSSVCTLNLHTKLNDKYKRFCLHAGLTPGFCFVFASLQKIFGSSQYGMLLTRLSQQLLKGFDVATA